MSWHFPRTTDPLATKDDWSSLITMLSQPDDDDNNSHQPITHERTSKQFKSLSFAENTGHLLFVPCQQQSKFISCSPLHDGHQSCHVPTSVFHYTSTRLYTTNLRNVSHHLD
jgi:hypothetical protein